MTTEPRLVFAIDVTTSMVSMAWIREPEGGGIGVPKRAWVTPVSQATHSPYSTWHHATAAAELVMQEIEKRGVPTLVIMAKQLWGLPSTDPSAERRFRIYNAIESRLFEKNIPVTEFPYATAAKWMLGHTPRGGVMAALDEAVTEEWGIERPTFQTKEHEKTRRYPYRLPVVALSAAAAMAVGIETSIPTTSTRLEILRGEGNASVQWAKDRVPPRALSTWEKLRDDAGKLKDIEPEGV